METTLASFDPNGNKTEVQVLNGPVGSAALTVVQTSYDALNRAICVAERNNATAFGALPGACIQGPGGAYGPDHITQFAYDLAGQKLTETRGVGTCPIQALYGTWTYGADGEVAVSINDAVRTTRNVQQVERL